jgi:GntR family galactonate operon transcriptional repressor
VASYAGRGLHGQAVELIARRIASGAFREEETLDLSAFQDELGVGLTAIREALKVLAAKGLVDARPKRGTFVRPRDQWDLLDGDVIRWQFSDGADPRLLEQLGEVREIVEPAGARLAALRRTDDDLAVLQSAVDAMAAATGLTAAISADLAFHRALLAASHNRLLERVEVVLETVLAERNRLVHGSHLDLDPVPTHRAVLDAIRDRDDSAAERATQALLSAATDDLARISRRG